MKKSLPIFIKPSGFTLIELMVVVAIIAILAVIGLAIFQNAQKNARDGIRRGEINNFAKSIESAKDPTADRYQYTQTSFDADYPTNKPRDPSKSPQGPWYCVLGGVGQQPPDNPGYLTWSGTCPTGWQTLVNDSGTYNVAVTNPLVNPGPPPGTRSWKICAKLEVPTGQNSIFCIGSSQ